MNKNIVIIGSGISGLLSALILSQNRSNHIHLIEKKSILGGLHGYSDYGENGRFDYGAHNILESGIKELDDFLINLLPKDEWHITSAVNEQKRTLTGIYFNGKLQINTSCIDLRSLPNSLKSKFIKGMIDSSQVIKEAKNSNLLNANEYAIRKFGESLSKNVFNKIIENIFDTKAEDLNEMVYSLLGISRVCLLNIKEIEELRNIDPNLAQKFCYPQQRDIPKSVLSTLQAYYPKNFGMYRVIDAIKDKLIANNNVTIHLNSEINNININNNIISSLFINENKLSNVEHLISSTNLNTLAKLVNIKINDLEYDIPPKTVLANILIDKPLMMKDLSYFYCYDKNFKTFRVDNYYNYCGEGAIRNKMYPVTVEMLIKEKDINKKQLKVDVINELLKFGVINESFNITLNEIEVLDYGFPLLTQKNIQSTNIIRERIESLKIKNLTKIGILSEKNLFFEGAIKIDLYNKCKKL